jgi:hypothetical protein
LAKGFTSIPVTPWGATGSVAVAVAVENRKGRKPGDTRANADSLNPLRCSTLSRQVCDYSVPSSSALTSLIIPRSVVRFHAPPFVSPDTLGTPALVRAAILASAGLVAVLLVVVRVPESNFPTHGLFTNPEATPGGAQRVAIRRDTIRYPERTRRGPKTRRLLRDLSGHA